MRPIIGITHSYEDNFAKLNIDYLKAVSKFGGISLIIPYSENIDSILKITNGIILSGGGDLSKHLLSEKLSPKATNICEKRDIFEAKLCKAAYEENIPLLGICRGIQVMNTALGGRICQHIDGHMQSPEKTTSHKISIEKNSSLFKISNLTSADVNSYHHQCVTAVSSCLSICARSSDFTIEAIEAPNKTFFLGVQWHPEKTIETDELSKAIFKNFITACRNK